MSLEIPEEKAKQLFLKYFRICKDVDQSKESASSFCDKFITAGEEVEYWQQTKEALIEIE